MERRRLTAALDDKGFASLVIAIVLVLILSLMTVGFAELMRHEQRSALDKQLSSQAYYAAESGVNDAAKTISDGYTGAKTKCPQASLGANTSGLDNTNPGYAAAANDLNSNVVGYGSNPTAANYPCLLINPYPPNLYYNPITTTESRTAEFIAIDSSGVPAAVTSVEISWQDAGSNTSFSGDCTTGNTFTSNASWGHVGVLRAMLLPITSGGLDRSTLTNTAFTGFLCPNGAGGSPPPGSVNYTSSIGATNAGQIVKGNCNTSSQPQFCNVIINGLPPNQSTFFINIRSIYAPTAVTISAFNGATPLRLKGAQTLVDSTGKAQDVLRRVQVRVPSANGYDIPDGVHGDICKQLDLDPDNTTSNGSGCDSTVLSL